MHDDCDRDLREIEWSSQNFESVFDAGQSSGRLSAMGYLRTATHYLAKGLGAPLKTGDALFRSSGSARANVDMWLPLQGTLQLIMIYQETVSASSMSGMRDGRSYRVGSRLDPRREHMRERRIIVTGCRYLARALDAVEETVGDSIR